MLPYMPVTRRTLEREIALIRGKLKTNPKDADLHQQLAMCLNAIGKKADAFKEIETAVRLEPKEPYWRSDLAHFYLLDGDRVRALQNYQKAALLVTTSTQDKAITYHYSYEAAKLLHSMGRYHEAERTYEQELARLSAYADEIAMTNRPDARVRAAIVKDIEGKLANIRTRLASGRPPAAWLRKELPRLELDSPPVGKDERDRMEELAGKVESGQLGGPGPHYLLGGYYLNAGRADKALIELLAALELDPKDAYAASNLGRAYLKLGRLDDAASAFRKAAALGSDEDDQLAVSAQAASERFRKSRPGVPLP